MKSHFASIYARTVFVAMALVGTTGCVYGPSGYYVREPYDSPYVSSYDYWYYPAIGSYYDPRSRVYIYYEHDHWIHAPSLPRHLRPHRGRHVTIHSPHNRPYDEHHRHREHYRPERYRLTVPGDQTRDIWLGAPRREPGRRDHDRDDRRHDDGERDRIRKAPARDRDHGGDRGLGPVKREYREQRGEYQRQPTATRRQEAPGRREPPAHAAPVRQENKAREREIRKLESETRVRKGDGRPHGDGKRDDPPVLRDGRTGQDRPDWFDRWKDH